MNSKMALSLFGFLIVVAALPVTLVLSQNSQTTTSSANAPTVIEASVTPVSSPTPTLTPTPTPKPTATPTPTKKAAVKAASTTATKKR